jgi:hypothetical protein
VFTPVSKIFEAPAPSAAASDPEPDRLSDWIGMAWASDDGWLRACAVRASRSVPGFDRGSFGAGDGGDAIVRAELEALPAGRTC